MSHQHLTLPTILCCICGIEIQTNPTNMCLTCLHDRVDITEDLNKKLTIHSCRTCQRFLAPPWQEIALESKELMVVCLRKIHGLNKLKLIDASWIWTEPHSMRLKIKLTLQKEIMNGAIVQQSTLVEFVIRNQQCKHCEASFATGAWHAIVQVRQRVSHKRTFYYLEQLILKHDAHNECIKIMTFKDGIDFYFKEKNQALRFIDFLHDSVPTKMKYSRKLVSADIRDNTADYKHNYLIEIVPICKDDLIVLPKELASKQSNISPLVLAKRVGGSIFVVDPLTGERTDVNSEKYWRYNFPAILSSRQLIRYIVLNVEPVLHEQRPSARMKRVGENQTTTRMISRLAECVVVRERDFGNNDIQFTCLTHLGPLLSPGDIVMGYDLSSSNFNLDDDATETLRSLSNVPDVILVRKRYEHRGERKWELKNLKNLEENPSDKRDKHQDYEADLEDFLQQVEGDRELRQHINVYKRKPPMTKKRFSSKLFNKKERMEMDEIPSTQDMTQENQMMDEDNTNNQNDEDYDEEEIRLDELLEGLELHSDLEDDDEVVDNTNKEEGDEDVVIQPQYEIDLEDVVLLPTQDKPASASPFVPPQGQPKFI